MDMEMEEEREEYCEEVKCTSNLGKNKLKIFSINVFSRAEVGLLFFLPFSLTKGYLRSHVILR